MEYDQPAFLEQVFTPYQVTPNAQAFQTEALKLSEDELHTIENHLEAFMDAI